MNPMTISSPAFQHEARIPTEFSCEGKDISPELDWTNIPKDTKSFVLKCVDPDAPMGDWIHWLVWNIPSETTGLPAAIDPKNQNDFTQGTNSWGRTGYGGPCPPPGHGTHRYYFTLYALDVQKLGLPTSATHDDLMNTIDGHILQKAFVMGTYHR